MAICVIAGEVACSAIVVSSPLRWARVILVILVALAGLLPTWYALRAPQTNIDVIAERLARSAEKGDLIVLGRFEQGISLGRYYKGNADWTASPLVQWHPILHRYDILRNEGFAPKAIEPLLSVISETMRGGHRVWFVSQIPPFNGRLPPEPPPGWHRLQFMDVQVGHFIQAHALNLEWVDVNEKAAMRYENPFLTVASGWKLAPDEPTRFP